MIEERDVTVPMRDGTLLRADVYRPDGGDPVPAVLSRTPYDRGFGLTPPAALDPERAVEAGFAMVCQDVRGMYGSEGEFYPFVHEALDGFDTVEWIAAEPWCSGAVGMAGRSYTAATQWLAASERPPHLRAISPTVVGSSYLNGWVYQGGALQLGFNLFWVHLMTPGKKKASLEGQYRHLPLPTAPLLEESPAGRFYRDWLAHPTPDEFWEPVAIDRRYPDVEVPALIVGGWYDLFLRGTLDNYTRLRRDGGSEAARAATRLLIGPWAHGSTYGAYPDHAFKEFAPDDRVDIAEIQLEFFAGHLRDGEAKAADHPPVRIFVMGDNRWRDTEDWPPPEVREERWFLHSDGDAADAGGTLSREAPADESPDRYVFDPHDPAPTIGGPTSIPGKFMRTNAGPLDQRPIEARPDALVYTSAALEEPLEVTGPLSLVLHAATSARDTDFVGTLSDVDEEGVSRILAQGVLRARFRGGFESAVEVEPDRVYEYEVDLVATSNVFLPGHRIRLTVTGSSFPRFDRNAGTGAPPGEVTEDDLTVARQTVLHDGDRASHLLLPVIPRS
jgi:putative CocE/NonD family hydrolase